MALEFLSFSVLKTVFIKENNEHSQTERGEKRYQNI